jgi:hypothetical protein
MQKSLEESHLAEKKPIRFPDIKVMKEYHNPALLGIRLHYGDKIPRKTILDEHVVSRGTYDRAIASFKRCRTPGKRGQPMLLSIFEEGLLTAELDKRILSGIKPTYAEITVLVFRFVYFIFTGFF